MFSCELGECTEKKLRAAWTVPRLLNDKISRFLNTYDADNLKAKLENVLPNRFDLT